MAHEDRQEEKEGAGEVTDDLAVLMLGFGGPGKFEDVRPFVENVVRGRNVPKERIDAVVEQYRQIGGNSPFNELTGKQAKALERELRERFHLPAPVHCAMLFWHPYVEDVLAELSRNGVRRIVALVMSPHRSEASFDRYKNRCLTAAESCKIDSTSIEFTDQWHSHPLFISAAASRVATALDALAEKRPFCRVVFTAHSIPVEMSGASTYAAQIEESSKAVARQLEIDDWCIAYQSRSGSPRQPWLEPDVREALAAAKAGGRQAVVVMPIGFVCDHVEVLFDLDIQARTFADEIGIPFVRAETVGVHPDFTKLLADRVVTAIQKRDWLETARATV